MKHGERVMERELEPLISLFRLLADKTRVHILMMLSDGERNVGSLCEELGLPQPTVSHHLGLLRMQNLISNRRNGKQIYYALNGHVNTLRGEGLEVVVDSFNVRINVRKN
ncbi:MAG TPA: metalloregulator ArsR/SmtB family transcription factor [Tepidisphaeraceae bacterium]|nr:metalloregulator ArsR/SmtB family transcription factor [Tepidisphaeraceae bacterium]